MDNSDATVKTTAGLHMDKLLLQHVGQSSKARNAEGTRFEQTVRQPDKFKHTCDFLLKRSYGIYFSQVWLVRSRVYVQRSRNGYCSILITRSANFRHELSHSTADNLICPTTRTADHNFTYYPMPIQTVDIQYKKNLKTSKLSQQNTAQWRPSQNALHAAVTFALDFL